MADARVEFSAFGPLQLLASVHIFVHHLWQQASYLDPYWFRAWGPSWVSCFFVLSGFKLTYTQLRRRDPSKIEDFVPYSWRRLIRLVPTYYVSLALVFADKKWSGHFVPTWVTLPFNALLIFTWMGSTAGGWHAGWHGSHWYMGDLLFHQICWRFVCPWVSKISLPACWGVLTCCVVILFLRLALIKLEIAEQKVTFFAPYTFNQFLAGMVLARLIHCRVHEPGVPADRLALLVRGKRWPLSGVLTLLANVLIFRFHPGDVHEALPNGVWSGMLLPVHLLLVWNITLEEGPLDWLAQRRPFCWAGELSYGVYIFHWNAVWFVVKYGKRWLPQRWPEEARFCVLILPATILLAALVARLIDDPIQAWGRWVLRRYAATDRPRGHEKAA